MLKIIILLIVLASSNVKLFIRRESAEVILLLKFFRRLIVKLYRYVLYDTFIEFFVTYNFTQSNRILILLRKKLICEHSEN